MYLPHVYICWYFTEHRFNVCTPLRVPPKRRSCKGALKQRAGKTIVTLITVFVATPATLTRLFSSQTSRLRRDVDYCGLQRIVLRTSSPITYVYICRTICIDELSTSTKPACKQNHPSTCYHRIATLLYSGLKSRQCNHTHLKLKRVAMHLQFL